MSSFNLPKDREISLTFEASWLIIMFPIYIYLLFKCHQHRHHFVIRNRFPKISIAIFITCCIIQIISLISSLTGLEQFGSIGMVLSSNNIGLIFYRTHLVYIRSVITIERLRAITNSDTNTISIKTLKSQRRHNIVSNAILIFNILCAVCIAIFRFTAIWPMAPGVFFMLQMLIGIAIVVNILRAKVRESIGCIQECIFCIGIIFVLSVGGPFYRSAVPEYVPIGKMAGFLSVGIQAFVIIFIPLRIIHQNQKQQQQQQLPTMDATAPSLPSSIRMTSQYSEETISNQSGIKLELPPSRRCSSVNLTISEESQVLPMSNFDSTVLDKPLHTFLQTAQHYQLFAGYLSECFALENLLFLERSVILYHMILKYKRMDDKHVAAEKKDQNEVEVAAKCYGLRFDYLDKIYAEMDLLIWSAVQLDEANMVYGKGIIEIIKMLYTQFCKSYSVAEINVSYGVQYNLQCLLEQNDEEILKKLSDYDQLSKVFHDAIVEVWRVCESVYGFQFRQYCKRRAQNA